MDNLNFKIGAKMNNWTIISEIYKNKWGKKSVTCECICGMVQNHELSKLPYTKCCRKCYIKSKEKSLDEIKEYRRFWHTKKKYNITKEDFERMWTHQEGKCAICGISMTYPEHKIGQELTCVAIDHNHSTNKNRELLCFSCNKGLGYFKENLEIFKNAIKYLNKHEEVSINTNN